ncbi:hypothetical protein [Sediminibacterium salmoneum]|uniref:hypothetical protein n=1 Tax=Sediminibacterium salmoneum TaxID=426421 RepID=UPI00047E3AA6|nr:hypothetical protein [Sediminibacterium salmoneum]
MRKLICSLIIFLVAPSVHSQEIDSILTTPKSPFFTDLISKRGEIQPLNSPDYPFVKPQSPWLKTRKYQFFKLGSALYIHFNGSGLLYRLQNPNDSLLQFKRIDDTENYNYNIDAFVFTHKKDIYNIGGYGFWQSTGVLRKYNTKDLEWDAEPVNQEIHLPFASKLGTSGQLSWFNTQKQQLYIPYQTIINEGVIKEQDFEVNKKETYRFNLKTKEWEKLGNINNDYYNLLQNAKWIIGTDSGQIICYNHKAYQVHYGENEIKINDDPSFVQSLERINSYNLAYYQNQHIYYLNGFNWQYDSVNIPSSNFKTSGMKIWKKKGSVIPFVVPIVLLAGAAAVRRKQNNEKKAAEKISDAITKTESPSLSIGHGKISPTIRFSETEKQLIRLLLEKSKREENTTITEINYVLGIKDKNVGLQKKVRSEVMNSINEKFSFLYPNHKQLIGNTRSQEDKRYFEYYVEEQHFGLIETVLTDEALP